MNVDISIFFYNFIPGVTFVLIWYYLLADLISFRIPSGAWAAVILLVGVLGLLLGFVLQTFWSIAKGWLDSIIVFPKSNTTKNEFDKNNRFLWIQKMEKLPEYFSARGAIWGNVALGSFVSIFFAWRSQFYFSIIAFGVAIIAFYCYLFYKGKEVQTVNSLAKEMRSK